IPIEVRTGYGSAGTFHITERAGDCGDASVYDGTMGCYSLCEDRVYLNRPGLRELGYELKKASGIDEEDGYYWFIVAVMTHEIGHWLGVPHAPSQVDSVMTPNVIDQLARGAHFGTVSLWDATVACAASGCQ